ncbi:MAG: four-helix bundle copper-binding protein [Planctomycetes bacterium]|nr:four-helix bundle copper-binding protein [Planctomycetota bacterium]
MSFRLFAIVALVLAACCAFIAYGQDKPAKKEGMQHEHMRHAEVDEALVKALGDCAGACDSCADYCIDMVAGGMPEHAETLRSCLDCATVCGAAACVAGRAGPYTSMLTNECAEVCAACAAMCEKMPDDAQMKKCAEACRACEKACRAAAKSEKR